MSKFYVYGHYTQDTDVLFYIGKGSGRRSEAKDNRSRFWHNIVKKHGFTSRVLAKFDTEAEALRYEIEAIGFFGRRDLGVGPLINMTDGGEGITGAKLVRSAEYLEKQSARQKGRIFSPETRAKMSAAAKNRTAETRKKLSVARRKRVITEETKQRLSEASKATWAARKSQQDEAK